MAEEDPPLDDFAPSFDFDDADYPENGKDGNVSIVSDTFGDLAVATRNDDLSGLSTDRNELASQQNSVSAEEVADVYGHEAFVSLQVNARMC